MAGIAQTEEASKSRKDDVEMEISWGVGLKEKAQQLVNKKLDEKGAETTWEQQLAKRREKLKAKRQEKKQLKVAPPSSEDGDDSDIPSDIDMNDPYFKEEFEKEEFRGKKSKKDKKKEDQDASDKTEEGNAAELDLLLMDENDGKKHFSLKSILKEEEKTSKGKKNKNKNDAPVVATAVGGLRTAVADGISGVLVDGHDAKAWSSVIARLLLEPQRRVLLSMGAIEHASHFGWENTARKTLDVYDWALSKQTKSKLRLAGDA